MDIQVEKRLIELKEGSFIFEFNDSLGKNECDDIIKRFENSSDQHYQGRIGQNLKGKVIRTICSGRTVYKSECN